MDAQLKQLADASLAVTAAEEAVADAAYHGARDKLDAVEEVLELLRQQWPSLSRSERSVVAPAAGAIKQRSIAVARRIPRIAAVTAVEPETGTESGGSPGAGLTGASQPPPAGEPMSVSASGGDGAQGL